MSGKWQQLILSDDIYSVHFYSYKHEPKTHILKEIFSCTGISSSILGIQGDPAGVEGKGIPSEVGLIHHHALDAHLAMGFVVHRQSLQKKGVCHYE